jgi:hypothetical protein
MEKQWANPIKFNNSRQTKYIIFDVTTNQPRSIMQTINKSDPQITQANIDMVKELQAFARDIVREMKK